MNHLSRTDRLANRFSVMRHGQSKANAEGLIVSRIENDHRGDYGLSELGRRQVLAAARDCGLPASTVICSSDFSRASQTADIVRACLGAPEVVVEEALRERYFGDWEEFRYDYPGRHEVCMMRADCTRCGFTEGKKTLRHHWDRGVDPFDDGHHYPSGKKVYTCEICRLQVVRDSSQLPPRQDQRN